MNWASTASFTKRAVGQLEALRIAEAMNPHLPIELSPEPSGEFDRAESRYRTDVFVLVCFSSARPMEALRVLA
jgi:hypothetical protein